MATKPKRNKATAPSRNKRGGGGGTPKKKTAKGSSRSRKPKAKAVTPTEETPTERQGLPLRAERQGTRRIHSRVPTPSEAKKRQGEQEKRRADEVAAQAQHRKELSKQGKGWGGARAARGATRGR